MARCYAKLDIETENEMPYSSQFAIGLDVEDLPEVMDHDEISSDEEIDRLMSQIATGEAAALPVDDQVALSVGDLINEVGGNNNPTASTSRETQGRSLHQTQINTK